jgi:hypothetical protein
MGNGRKEKVSRNLKGNVDPRQTVEGKTLNLTFIENHEKLPNLIAKPDL